MAKGASGFNSGGGNFVKGYQYSGPNSYSDLPALQGSEKQIKWAEKIRREMLNDLGGFAQDTINSEKDDYGNEIYNIYKNEKWRLYYPKYVNRWPSVFEALEDVYSQTHVDRAIKYYKHKESGMGKKELNKFISDMKTEVDRFERAIEKLKKEKSAKWWIENRHKRYSKGDRF